MRRVIIVGMLVVTGVALAVPGQAAAKKTVHFTATVTGAAISPVAAVTAEYVFKVHDSVFGDGAGVQTVHGLLSGTDVIKVYYGDATTTAKDTYSIGAPNAQLVAPLTGSGHNISGTGKLKHIKSTFTFSGTINLMTGLYTITLTGTETY